jgi:hypothetical protein
MDLIDRLNALNERFVQLKDNVKTEEATKNAFVMPFITALGYDVFNPMEVVPEFIADIGTKKGEKVDYCIQKDGKPIIIMECKDWRQKLDIHTSQLHRYFNVVHARFAILTNGEQYQFFADLLEPNKMDEHPFLEFSITNITEQLISELKKFRKDSFDLDAILSTASDLKFSKKIKEILSSEFKDPSEEFIKYFASRVYPGRITSKVMEQFNPLVKKSIKQLINEIINDRLKSAMSVSEHDIASEKGTSSEASEEIVETDTTIVNDVETTDEELSGFRIIQAILAPHIDITKVTHRDKKSYFGILYDDNNRKPICRLHFNRSQKQISLFDDNRVENKFPIERLEDIYQYAEQIISIAKAYHDS